MKPYSILIHGTGACGEGNAQSADIALQKLLEQLRTSGHTLTSVSMVIDGSTVPIIGAMQPHPEADEPASSDAVSLVSISRQLAGLVNLLSQDAEDPCVFAGNRLSDENSETQPVVTLETLSQQLSLLSTGQDGLFTSISDLSKKLAAGKPSKEPKAGKQLTGTGATGSEKKEGAAGDEKPGPEVKLVNEPPKGAGTVPEGALPLPGSTGAAEGDNQEQPGTTSAEGAGDEGGTTTETTQNEEGAEG